MEYLCVSQLIFSALIVRYPRLFELFKKVSQSSCDSYENPHTFYILSINNTIII